MIRVCSNVTYCFSLQPPPLGAAGIVFLGSPSKCECIPKVYKHDIIKFSCLGDFTKFAFLVHLGTNMNRFGSKKVKVLGPDQTKYG